MSQGVKMRRFGVPPTITLRRFLNRRMVWLAGAILSVSPLSGCRAQPSDTRGAKEFYVDKIGSYEKGDFKIEIIKDKAMIKITIKSHPSEKPIFVRDIGGDFSRWYVCWPADDNIWIYSGDTSVVRLVFNKDLSYQLEEVNTENPSKLVPKMSDEFYSHLPQTLKKSWDQYRKTSN